MSVFGGEIGADSVHRFPVRIYFEDTDFSGHVYHAAYLKFFERARTEYLRALGVHHHELVREGLAFAVSRLEIDYLRPARIDDLLVAETRVVAGGAARLTLSQVLMREGEALCRAQVTAVLLGAKGRPVRLPAVLQASVRG